MKKFSLFMLFLIILGGLFYLLSSHLESDIDPVSLLPSGTITLLDLHNPAKSYARFKKSRLGRKIDSIPRKEILLELGLTDEQADHFATRSYEIQTILESPLFREIIGRRALFALLPASAEAMHISGRSDLRDQLLLICRPQHRASLLKLFSYFFTGSYEYRSYSYMGKSIRKYTFDNMLSVYSSVTDGLVVIALSEKSLQDALVRSLKYMTGSRTGLDTSEKYINLKKRAEGRDDQFFYVDLEKITAGLNENGGGPRQLMTNQANRNLLPLSFPYSRFAFYRQSEKYKFKYSAVLQYNHKNHGPRKSLLFAPPVRNRTLQNLPADLVLYFWTNVFNFNSLWNTILQTAGPQQVEILNYLEQWTMSRTGLSMDQVSDLFGHQFSLNIAEIRTSGFLPLPRVCVRLELVDPAGTEAVIKQLFDEFTMQQVMVGHHTVHSLMLAGGLMRPSYAFVDNFLVIADSQEQIIHVLEKKKKLLIRDSSFKKIDIGLNKPNNIVLYFKTDQLVESIKEIFSLVGTLIPNDAQKNGAAGKIIVDRVLLPVLDGLKMFEAKSVRGFYNESEIIMESALLLKNE